MKKLYLALAMMTVIAAMNAEAVVIQGEQSAGVYTNIKTDSSGNLYTTTAVAPTAGALTDRSGTITAGGTAQTAIAANSSRKYLFIQNNSDTNMWVNFTTTAVATQPSILLIPGASLTMEGSFVSTELVSVIGATTGKTFTAKEY